MLYFFLNCYIGKEKRKLTLCSRKVPVETELSLNPHNFPGRNIFFSRGFRWGPFRLENNGDMLLIIIPKKTDQGAKLPIAHFKILYVEECLNQVMNLDFKSRRIGWQEPAIQWMCPGGPQRPFQGTGTKNNTVFLALGAYNLRHI